MWISRLARRFATAAAIAALGCALPAQAQEQPVVYSQTIIALVPGTVVPKAVSQSPSLQSPQEDASEKTPPNETGEMLAQATAPKLTLRVQVRGDQIALNRGLFTNYRLDAAHGVLTYFNRAEPRDLVAENIHKPLDVLFIRDDGIVAQIVPEIVMAYLPDDISVDFPVRALLFMEAGRAAEWGIQPGYRVEHGMFNPKPLIYKVEDGSS